MIKLILAGGGGATNSKPLDKLLVKLIAKDKRKMVYIPIAMESRPYSQCYQWIISVFSPLRFTNITMWTNLNKKRYADLKEVGAMYIGGGNTFKLLNDIKRSGFIDVLEKFILSGRVVYGGSAGAIILGRNIQTSSDENKINLKDTTGLNLIEDHSIFCHYNKNYDPKIFKYVKQTATPVIALTEKSGVFVEDKKLKSVGFEPAFLFTSKKKTSHKPNTFFKI